MAITFINKGTWAAGTTSIAPGIPASMAAGDLMILQVHTCNQAVTTPAGWTLVTGSPVSTGTANAAGGTRINAYYRFWQSGDAAPTVAVTGGTVTNGIIAGYRGVHQTTPFDATPVATTLATANATLTMTGITTVTANALIHWAIARDQDLNTTTAVTAFVNANLTGITEVHDQVVNTGVGGGIWTGYGFKATAGATGNLVITQTSSIAVGLTIALRPAPTAYSLTAQGGSYSVTGASALLSRNRNLVASGGSYSYTGASATITWASAPLNNYVLTAQGGAYVLAGASATISRNRKLSASGGSYAVTGASAGLFRNKRLIASGGSYAVSGSSALLLRNRKLIASGGAYSYVGANATITYVPNSVGYTLIAQGGTYALSGANATLLRSKRLIASGGSYSYVGASAVLKRNRKLLAVGGAYAWAGSSATITRAGMSWPLPSQVLFGIQYGPTGVEYTGTLEVGATGYVLDISSGSLVKVLSDKLVMTL